MGPAQVAQVARVEAEAFELDERGDVVGFVGAAGVAADVADVGSFEHEGGAGFAPSVTATAVAARHAHQSRFDGSPQQTPSGLPTGTTIATMQPGWAASESAS